MQDGWTALYTAARYRHEEAVKALLQAGADKEAANKVAARSSLVLVGPGAAGKTTLAVRLETGKFDKDVQPTHGLLVHEWSVPECEGQPPLLFSIWDLGGQEVYWSTHAFFMVREALYVTVYNSRNKDIDCFGEYLDRVKLLVPGKAPLLVATHALEGDFKAQEPPAPVLKAHGIDANTIISVRRERKALVSAGRPPLICLDEFEDIAERVSIVAPHDLRRCMDRLTDMGELRHFSDVPGLEDVVVIDPKWLADLMAQIVTTDKTRMQNLGPNKGWTSMDALQKVVEMKCPPGTGRVIGLVRLMQHCGLVYALPSGDAVIPPMLPDRMKEPWESIRANLVEKCNSLPKDRPWGWWAAQYKYGRLLDHRLSRLLCRLLLLLPDAEVSDVWRFGALLVRPQRALMALTCTRQETSNEYTLHVAVCAPAPEVLGARVSSLLGEELGGVEVGGG
ncbi:hypothetical protein GPECTOR_346g94 [Gonium pectorale]|uniref:COR domain-containing protein n=1 Tax=Gonium pectorale TaxID=33097 RepID=A0A150FVJ7_GONPE|nr:hypothetical protein GPECTOR_346g94 [Gonium pectorale]|eukprot:KXZ41641.1 hypothetical protein GPECTOR_346g94 [Gonium pectorale]